MDSGMGRGCVLILTSKFKKIKIGSQLSPNCSRLDFQHDMQKFQLYNILEKQH